MSKVKFIKVTVMASGLSSIVPIVNKPHYEQANDLEKKAKKSPIYNIEEATENEIVEYYPELAKGQKTASTIELSNKNKEIEALKAEVAKQTDLNQELEKKNKEIEALKAEVAKNKKQ